MRRVIVACLVYLASAGPAAAVSAEVIWPTFLRTGPDQRFGVTDELLRGARLDVEACAERWCRVRRDNAVGYVDRTALSPIADVPPATTRTGDCFDSTRSGRARGETWRFCR